MKVLVYLLMISVFFLDRSHKTEADGTAALFTNNVYVSMQKEIKMPNSVYITCV